MIGDDCMAVKLYEHQKEAIEKLKNGSVLCGGVGSGKSIAALAYYMIFVCYGSIDFDGYRGLTEYFPMEEPKDLYIITTAQKRDKHEWDMECIKFMLTPNNPEASHSGVRVTIDSWNNIKKYSKVFNAFFIFDEQRVIGKGAWVKAFLDISRKNQWILLSATPGDQWSDYIPVFVANGFVRNKTEFYNRYCVFSRVTKYPKIDRYLEEATLEYFKNKILVPMEDFRDTVRRNINVICNYDKETYRKIFRERWDPYDDTPIEEGSRFIFLLRKCVNSDPSRIAEIDKIMQQHDRAIIFYNFNYELDMLRNYCESTNFPYGEWNGQKHEGIPKESRWLYLVQYAAGSEGWNCTVCDTVIFYSQTYSYRTLEQAMGRIDRIDTAYRELFYYHLRSMSSIDLAINRKLKDKKKFNENNFIKKVFI